MGNIYISEMKALTHPPAGVKLVMDAVMVYLGKPIGWASAKKEMRVGDIKFLNKIKTLIKKIFRPKLLRRLKNSLVKKFLLQKKWRKYLLLLLLSAIGYVALKTTLSF